MLKILEELILLARERKNNPVQGSYTNKILEDKSNKFTEQNKENLKTSAKAKLIAGEALTEDEANTIVL